MPSADIQTGRLTVLQDDTCTMLDASIQRSVVKQILFFVDSGVKSQQRVLYMLHFRRIIEHQLCKYDDMTSVCNKTVADYYAYYYQTDIDIWLSSSCGTFDLSSKTVIV